MRTLGRPVLIFLIGGMVGPLLRWTTWPPGPVGTTVSDLTYDLVMMLWPTQPLAVVEANTGLPMAVAISVGANLVLFGVVGLIAGLLARRPRWLIALYACVSLMLILLASWSTGGDFSITNLIALVIALGLYAGLFIASFRSSRFAR